MTAYDQQVQEIKETVPLDLTGLLPKKFRPQRQGVTTNTFKIRSKPEESPQKSEDKETTLNQKKRMNLQKEC